MSDSSSFAQRRLHKKIIQEASVAINDAQLLLEKFRELVDYQQIPGEKLLAIESASISLKKNIEDNNTETNDIRAALGALDLAINVLADDCVNRLKAQLDPAVQQFKSWGKER